MLTLVGRERLLLILCHSVVAIYVPFLFQMLGSVLSEDDAVSAETCRRYNCYKEMNGVESLTLME
jgi:hypothetical protein